MRKLIEVVGVVLVVVVAALGFPLIVLAVEPAPAIEVAS